MSVIKSTKIIEEKGTNYFRTQITNSERATFRQLTGNDYGIDGIVETFESGNPTGKIAFIQIKSTESIITNLIREPDYISCPNFSYSNSLYCNQNNIPVFLIYNSLKNKNVFYYRKMNNYDFLQKQDSYSIRIPIENCCNDNANRLIDEIINHYK